MVPTSTPQLGNDFVKELVAWMIQAFGEATARAFRMFWDIGMTYLGQHWGIIIVVLCIIFIIALVGAFLTGRWAMLGRVVYSYLYFGVLFFVGLIWGPEVFANDYFKIFLAVLYFVCFVATGRFLKKLEYEDIKNICL